MKILLLAEEVIGDRKDIFALAVDGTHQRGYGKSNAITNRNENVKLSLYWTRQAPKVAKL